MKTISNKLLHSIRFTIRIYQKTISPDHGVVRMLFPHGVCRYHPTCSEYAIEALRIHKWHGIALSMRRIIRCHPFARGGADAVPPNHPPCVHVSK